jgi:hypothetical protein
VIRKIVDLLLNLLVHDASGPSVSGAFDFFYAEQKIPSSEQDFTRKRERGKYAFLGRPACPPP